MKAALLIVAEFFLFFALDIVGGVFYHPFHIETKLAATQSATRSFVWDGVVLMLLAWLILLLLSAVRRRFSASSPKLTAALVLALLAGFVLKVGFVTHNW